VAGFKPEPVKKLEELSLDKGDLPIDQFLHIIMESGYDSWLSIEFEGMEHCLEGTVTGFQYVQTLLNKGGVTYA
jgi:sugar phosphate isomerase/epimerase